MLFGIPQARKLPNIEVSSSISSASCLRRIPVPLQHRLRAMTSCSASIISGDAACGTSGVSPPLPSTPQLPSIVPTHLDPPTVDICSFGVRRCILCHCPCPMSEDVHYNSVAQGTCQVCAMNSIWHPWVAVKILCQFHLMIPDVFCFSLLYAMLFIFCCSKPLTFAVIALFAAKRTPLEDRTGGILICAN